MIFLTEHEVRKLLPFDDMLEALREAFIAQAQGQLRMPMRTIASTEHGLLGAMPAAISGATPALGAKLVTFFPDNAALGVHTHQALIALFDARTGAPLALMDGRYITEARTAATTALATRALARPDARVLAILGTGVQARAHVEALSHVMQVQELRVWGRTRANAESAAQFARERGLSAKITATAAEACTGADVICTVTSSKEHVLRSSDVRSGMHINAVGFAGPTAREVDAQTLAKAKIFVDSMEGARQESGNIRGAIADGVLPHDVCLTLLCDVIAGKTKGRTSSDDITLFNSLGIALEDVACARLVYDRASAGNVGTRLT